jgi:hypothetical protein
LFAFFSLITANPWRSAHRSSDAMSKKIVLLSDGTGNSSVKPQKTNVWRLFQALDQRGSALIAKYDDGSAPPPTNIWHCWAAHSRAACDRPEHGPQVETGGIDTPVSPADRPSLTEPPDSPEYK